MRLEKKYIVQELTREIKGANPLIFTEYKGMKAHDINRLRSKLTALSARCRVIKNRLFLRAMEDVGLEGQKGYIKGPVAIVYGGTDVIKVVKALAEFAKDYPETLVVKGGVVDETFCGLEEIKRLAKLPGREILLAKIVSQIGAPLQRLVMGLHGNVRRLVCVLDGIAKKK